MVINFSNLGGQGGVTTGQVQTMIDNNNLNYTPTSGFTTINGSAITAGGNIEIKGGAEDYLVTFTKVDDVWTSDKTVAEIKAAYNSGMNVRATTEEFSESFWSIPLKSISEDGDDYEIHFIGADVVAGSAIFYGPSVIYMYKQDGEEGIEVYQDIYGKTDDMEDEFVQEYKTWFVPTVKAVEDYISGHSGGGGEQVIELTQAEYNALTAYSEHTTYVITDAVAVDMSDYVDEDDFNSFSGVVETNLATKADKQNITNPYTGSSYYSSSNRLPVWNSQGVITGHDGNGWGASFSYVNGSSKNIMIKDAGTFTIYAPTAAGTQNQMLVSNGSGAPVWSTQKMVFITQTAYDNLATKDSTTFYFIIGD